MPESPRPAPDAPPPTHDRRPADDALLRDVFHARHDVVALAEAHGLTPSELFDWAARPATRRCLDGLRVLTDVQTQLQASRFKLHALSTLIRQATGSDDISPEQARKASVDLLRVDLAAAAPPPPPEVAAGDADDDALDAQLAALRAAFLAAPADDATDP